MSKLYIIIPAYNEEKNIENVAREWHDVVIKTGQESRLVVIDDGSKDNTYQILHNLETELKQLEVITKKNGGHGAAVLYGYNYAVSKKADFIFQTDSDGQTLSEEVAALCKKRNMRDAIIGYRNHRKDGISRIFVTKTLKIVLKIIFGVTVTDANTPFRLMRRELLEKYLPQIPNDFNLSNVMLTVYFVYNKENIEFLPITFRPRQGGTNSINLKKIIKIGIQAVKDFGTIKKTLFLRSK